MRSRSFALASCLLFMVSGIPSKAMAQITFTGGSFQTSVNVTMPGCTDDAGDVGVSPASVSCAAGGYSAAASAEAGLSTQFDGAEVSASGEAQAASAGAPFAGTSSASSVNTASAGWSLGAPTYYTLAVEAAGGAFMNFSGPGVSFPPPPSGVLTGSNYSLNVSVTVSAVAMDSNGAETVVATPQAVTARLTLAEVDSPTLIMGTVLAGGAAMPHLLIEAFDGLVPVATTRTANDGSYLLDGIGTSVTLRLSDPNGGFLTETSPLLTPPATYDADLDPVPAVPGLPEAALLGLALALMLVGTLFAARRAVPGD